MALTRKSAGLPDRADREIELKFLIAPEDVPLLEALPDIGARLKAARRMSIDTTYFDTADHRLERAGFTLRVRRQGKVRLLTAKQIAKAAIGRGEWERRIRGNKPVPRDLNGLPVAEMLADGETLQPLFASLVERARLAAKTGSSKIEIAFDRGRIVCGGKSMPVCELELELKRGSCDDLIVLARRLVEAAPLTLSFISKAERGFLLAREEWCKPKEASPAVLRSDMTALAAFLTICRCCLHDFMHNRPALANAADIEGVHQARIAIRRLRAAFALFSPRLDDPRVDHLGSELRHVARLLGAARDLDVFAAMIGKPRHEGDLAAEIARRRAAARVAMHEGLGSTRVRLFLLDLAAFLDGGIAGQWCGKPAMKIAGELLSRRLASLCKRSTHLRRRGTRQIHDVRIAAKQLRYMCEFFASLAATRRARSRHKKLVRTLERLQDSLGALHDREALAEFLAEVVGKDRTDWRAEARKILEAAKVHRRKEMAKALKAAAAIAEIKPFW